MSKNKLVNYSQYVHSFTTEEGATRYSIAAKVSSNYYLTPLTSYEEEYLQDLPASSYPTGALIVVEGHTFLENKKLSRCPNYATRAQALRRARYLFRGEIYNIFAEEGNTDENNP